jgi:hypothetical protein
MGDRVSNRRIAIRDIACAVAVAALAGCAAPQAVAPPPPPPPPPPSSNTFSFTGASLGNNQPGGPVGAINITPFTGLAEQWTPASAQGGIFADTYTRLIVTSETANGSGQGGAELPYIERWPIIRYLIGREFAMNLTASVTAGSFKATVPLLSLDHKSDSNVGEQWSRTVYHSAEAFPLFLVSAAGDGAIPSIRAELKGSIDVSSRLAATGVQVALAVAEDVSPQSKVVTELSKSSVQKKATAVDAAIGKLFGRGIDEGHWSDQDIRYWQWQKGVQITFFIPASESGFDSPGKLPVGAWTVTFDEPRPSLFVDWRICNPAAHAALTYDGSGLYAPLRCARSRDEAIARIFKDVDAASVLKTSLTDGDNNLGQIQNYLSQQDWYKAAQPNLSDPAKAANAAPDFCLHIRNTIIAVGLSTTDANIVVWAVATAMPDLAKSGRDAIAANAVCKKITKPISDQQA